MPNRQEANTAMTWWLKQLPNHTSHIDLAEAGIEPRTLQLAAQCFTTKLTGPQTTHWGQAIMYILQDIYDIMFIEMCIVEEIQSTFMYIHFFLSTFSD